MFGPYNGWNPTYDIYSDADGDGVYSLTLYLDQGGFEYKLFANADASSQENLLDFGTTIQGSDQWGDYYEYLNGSCATVTDYYSYANRLLTITAADINTSQTVSTCYGSCNDTCRSGCTDAASCTYTADDNLDENLAGQIHYDSDDGSCQYSCTAAPYCDNFDAGLSADWTNNGWILDFGGTPSGSTGPTDDISGGGNYIGSDSEIAFPGQVDDQGNPIPNRIFEGQESQRYNASVNLNYTLFEWRKQSGYKPLNIDKGEGVYLIDHQKNKILDFSFYIAQVAVQSMWCKDKH
mgnify:CR=1 FL=1